MTKPHYQIAIQECGEPLVPIPPDRVTLLHPHPYQQLGAPYGNKSPFFLRQRVCDRLLAAQLELDHHHPGWRIQVFDAYRPIAVQQFMVNHALQQLAQEQGIRLESADPLILQSLLQKVYEFWAPPSSDPAMPPPHSTGGAIDVTLVQANGQPVEMGAPIDEISPRSYPNHFANSQDPQEQAFHQNRQLLRQVMLAAGFQQHPNEWWHFCWGDQMWAWLNQQQGGTPPPVASYGCVA